MLSTRRLVDDVEDQRILEALLEKTKPPHPAGCRGLHWLLATPFRYPPLRHGSRFGARTEPSLWYGSVRIGTALAETAYYRLLFLEGTTADLGAVTQELSSFRAAWRSSRAVDLSRPPFDAWRGPIADPARYDETQRMGTDMRRDGVEAFRYPSARDPDGGLNVALFTPKAFSSPAPVAGPETWRAVSSRERVEFLRRDGFRDRAVVFPRAVFEVDGQLPLPAP